MEKVIKNLIVLSLCISLILLDIKSVNYYGNGLLYISTTSFSEINTGIQGSSKEYQMSGTANLAENGEIVLVSNAFSEIGVVTSKKQIHISDGFSMAFKLNMGEGTNFLGGNIQVLLEESTQYEGNKVLLDIHNVSEDKKIGASLSRIESGGEITETQDVVFSDFTQEGTIETDVYCWIVYSKDTKILQMYLSTDSKRPETEQVSYTHIDISEYLGDSFELTFSAENKTESSQKISLCSVFLDDKYYPEGIDISLYETEQELEFSNDSYIINEITYPLSIQYVYEDGTQAAEPYNGELKEGQAYSVISPKIAGYSADYRKIEGIMGGQGIEKTVTYTKIVTYADLPGKPSADIKTQSRKDDIWEKLQVEDAQATEEIYLNTSRPIKITAKQWDNSSMSGVEVSAFQLMYIGVDGYVINQKYQSFFNERWGDNTTAGDVLEQILKMNNEELVGLVEDAIVYTKNHEITPVTVSKGEIGSNSITLDCSRRYEQSRGYYGGYGYYILYGEDSAGMQYVLTEFTSRTPESSVYLKGNSLSLVKEVGKMDYSMNENIVFTIYATLPNLQNTSHIESYNYQIIDTYDKGITPLKDTLKLQVVDADENVIDLVLNDDYTLAQKDGAWEIRCNFATGTHLKDNQQKAKTLKVTYQANFNKNAVIGPKGNKNTAILYYTGNPAEETYVDKNTEESSVFVYTYRQTMTKMGSDHVSLKDAVFEVYDKDNNLMYFLLDEKDGIYRPTNAQTEDAISQIVTLENGTLQIDGVGTGDYTFVEIRPPDGYLLIPKFRLSITPEYLDGIPIKISASMDDSSYIESVECDLENGTVTFVALDPVQTGMLPGTGSMGKIGTYTFGVLFMGVGILAESVKIKQRKESKNDKGKRQMEERQK